MRFFTQGSIEVGAEHEGRGQRNRQGHRKVDEAVIFHNSEFRRGTSDDEIEVVRVGYRRFLTWSQRSPDFVVALAQQAGSPQSR